MLINWRLVLLPPLLLVCVSATSARQNHSAAQPADRIYLDVVVSPKSGSPVEGLQQSDFTIFDNDVPQTITSFEAVDGRQARIEVILVFDAMNIGSREAAITFEEIRKFLKSNGGRLAYPTAVTILTNRGLQSPLDFSQDGNAISARLSKNAIAARGISGAAPFQAFAQILADEREKPGR
jgi:VWFA-related protein